MTFPYLIFRFLFDEFYALQFLILFQIIISSISVYILGLLALRTSKRKYIFHLTIIIFTVFPFFIKEEILTTTTSMSASSFIFVLFYIDKYYDDNKKIYLLIASIFLLWLFLLRPFTLPYLFFLLIWTTTRKHIKLKDKITKLFIIISPFLVFESLWIYRNFKNTGNIIPLQDGYVPGQNFKYIEGCGQSCVAKYSVHEIRKLISSWGGSSVWYIEGTEMNWFLDGDSESKPVFNQHIYSKNFNLDSIINLKKLLIKSYDKKLTHSERYNYDELIVKKSRYYISEYKKNHFLDYYVMSHIKRVKNFLFLNPTMDWPGPSFRNSSIIYKIYKLGSIIIFAIICLSIFLYPILFSIKKGYKSNYLSNLCFLFSISLILIFSFLVELTSIFYFATGFIGGYIILINIIHNIFPIKN